MLSGAVLVTLRQERESVEDHALALAFSNSAHIFQGKRTHMTMLSSIGVTEVLSHRGPGRKTGYVHTFP